MKNGNRELIVSIRVQIERMPFSWSYRGLQRDLGKLSLAALLDLQEMLGEVESWGLGKKRPPARCVYCSQMDNLVAGLCKDCAKEEVGIADDCPECAGAGEVYENEADISSCARCEGTGTLS